MWRHQGGLRAAASRQRERCAIAISPWHPVAELAEFQRQPALGRRGCQAQEWMPIGSRMPVRSSSPPAPRRSSCERLERGAGVRTWRRTSVLRPPLPPRPCGGFPAAGFHSRPVSREFVRIRLKEQKWQELKGCHIVRRPRGLRSLWNCQVNATPAIRHRQPPPGGSPGTAIPGFVFDFTRAAMAGRPRATRGYCLSYTTTLLTVWPLAFLPVCVKVRVFPSFETTALAVAFCFPPNCVVISRVYASIRL